MAPSRASTALAGALRRMETFDEFSRRKAEQIGTTMQVQDVSVWKRARRRNPLGFDTAHVDHHQLGSTRRARHELREAGHPATDIIDLNI